MSSKIDKFTESLRQSLTKMEGQLETHHLSRETVLGLLSDDEVASVSTAETAAGLSDGEEYIDLQAIDQGVRRARGAVSMGRVLPRKAVHESTWNKILAQLPAGAVAPRTA